LNTHEIDLRECFVSETPTKIHKGEWADAKGSDFIIMSAAKTGAQVQSRNDYLFANLDMIRDTAKNIKNYAPEALLVSITAPVDAFVMVFLDELKCDRHKVMGFCINDSQRFKWALGQALDIDPQRTFGLVLGEHGESQVPVFSSVTVDNVSYKLKPPELEVAEKYLRNWYPVWQSQNSKRTTTWSSATGMLHTIYNLAGLPSPMPLMGSVLLEGEYGLHGVALGVPLNPGDKKWESVKEIPLTPEEKKELHESGDLVKEVYLKTK
jgi:malate/lactate dehydrogenase